MEASSRVVEDIGLALADFVSNLENVPSEVRHLFSEITDLDEQYEGLLSRAAQSERMLQKELKDQASREQAGEREEELVRLIDQEHTAAKSLCHEKMRLARKALTIVQRHLAKLDAEIRHFDKTPFDQKGAAYQGQGLLRIGTVGGGGGAGGAGLGDRYGAGNSPLSLGTVGLQNGELASSSFRLPTPKRFNDPMASSLGLDDGEVPASTALYTPSRAPKRRHNHQGAAGPPGAAGRSSLGPPGGMGNRPLADQRHKKQLKLASSVLSLDGIEVDGGGNGGGIEESDDQLYCFCQQVSYGDMVACDGPDCRHEWFHWECVGLTSPPKGAWYCSECLAKLLEEDED